MAGITQNKLKCLISLWSLKRRKILVRLDQNEEKIDINFFFCIKHLHMCTRAVSQSPVYISICLRENNNSKEIKL